MQHAKNTTDTPVICIISGVYIFGSVLRVLHVGEQDESTCVHVAATTTSSSSSSYFPLKILVHYVEMKAVKRKPSGQTDVTRQYCTSDT